MARGRLTVGLALALSMTGCTSTASTIRTDPAGAKVFVGDVYMGPSPVQVQLDDGARHSVRIAKDGYEPRVLTLDRQYAVGFIVLDSVACLPTLGFGCYLITRNGQRHLSEYLVRLEPESPTPASAAPPPASTTPPPASAPPPDVSPR